MRSVGIIYKYKFEPARIEALKLESWLKDRSVRVFSEEISIFEIDYDEQLDIVKRFNVESFPSVYFIKNGEILDIMEGKIPFKTVKNRIKKIIKTKD